VQLWAAKQVLVTQAKDELTFAGKTCQEALKWSNETIPAFFDLNPPKAWINVFEVLAG
jgi:hypothetical protein